MFSWMHILELPVYIKNMYYSKLRDHKEFVQGVGCEPWAVEMTIIFLCRELGVNHEQLKLYDFKFLLRSWVWSMSSLNDHKILCRELGVKHEQFKWPYVFVQGVGCEAWAVEADNSTVWDSTPSPTGHIHFKYRIVPDIA